MSPSRPSSPRSALTFAAALTAALALLGAGVTAARSPASSRAPGPGAAASTRQVVRGFLEEVRSGRHPERAAHYFAPVVRAHQVHAEGEATVERTPANYAAHVRDFLRAFGDYRFEVVELLVDGDRAYVRWRQTGHDLEPRDGKPATGKPLVELTSAVYRVEAGRIVEYWVQTDRKGMELQLAR
jgi:predicted ester cyclase